MKNTETPFVLTWTSNKFRNKRKTGEKRKKVTLQECEEMKELKEAGITNYNISKMYNVHINTISYYTKKVS